MSDENPRCDAVIFRILGNENIPRDIPGKRLEILKCICEEEPQFENTEKWFMVNRIYDINYRKSLCETLDQYNAHYITVNFDRSCSSDVHQIKAKGININAARNTTIRIGQTLGNYTVVLDGDCIFSQEEWDAVYDEIQKGKYAYLSIPTMRDNTNTLGECMLAFRYNSVMRFNTHIPFGDNEKLKLLYLLGHSPDPDTKHLPVKGDLTKVVGSVAHMATGNMDLESSTVLRVQTRNESLRQFSRNIIQHPVLHHWITGSLASYYEDMDGDLSYEDSYFGFARDIPEHGRFVQIGLNTGQSAIYLATRLQALGKTIWFACIHNYTETEFSNFMSHVYASQTQDIIFPVEMGSFIESAELYPDQSLDVVFLHDIPDYMEALQAWYPKVKPGGLISGILTDLDTLVPKLNQFFKGKPLELLPEEAIWKSIKYGDEPANERKRKWS